MLLLLLLLRGTSGVGAVWIVVIGVRGPLRGKDWLIAGGCIFPHVDAALRRAG